jgi:hypothetical protein
MVQSRDNRSKRLRLRGDNAMSHGRQVTFHLVDVSVRFFAGILRLVAGLQPPSDMKSPAVNLSDGSQACQD